jgi:hypothetical protein
MKQRTLWPRIDETTTFDSSDFRNTVPRFTGARGSRRCSGDEALVLVNRLKAVASKQDSPRRRCRR